MHGIWIAQKKKKPHFVWFLLLLCRWFLFLFCSVIVRSVCRCPPSSGLATGAHLKTFFRSFSMNSGLKPSDPVPTEIEKKANLGDDCPAGKCPRRHLGSIRLGRTTLWLHGKFYEKKTVCKRSQTHPLPVKASGMACVELSTLLGSVIRTLGCSPLLVPATHTDRQHKSVTTPTYRRWGRLSSREQLRKFHDHAVLLPRRHLRI